MGTARTRGTTEGVFQRQSRRVPNLALHVGGAALFFVGLGIGVSAGVEAGAGGEAVGAMAAASALVTAVGAVLWRLTRVPAAMTAGSTLAAVGATWALASIGGMVPFLFTDAFPTWDAALFESVSGFSGTGSTVLDPIEDAPRGVLFWRNMSQWYGGTGMVVLAVAILPFLGVGGMDLMRAEAPGPTTDRLAPRVSETAKRLWAVYAAFTVVSMLALTAAGMGPFDAVTHAFTVVSTGGLSPYNSSIGHFDSLAIELTLVALMLFGAVSFTLHYGAFSGDPGTYLRSHLFRFYAGVFAVFVVAITAILWLSDGVGIGRAVRDAVFNVTTLLTSTGYGTADFVTWAAGAQLLLFALMISGGMAGSTSGGLKLIRARTLLEVAGREVRRIRHPRAVLPIRLGGDPIEERIVQRVVGFSLLYFVFIGVGTVVLCFLGAGLLEAAGAAAGSMGNMGPSLGEAGPSSNFLYFSRPARAVIMVMMLAGRLEIFPVLYVGIRIRQSIMRRRRLAVGQASRLMRARAGSTRMVD